MSSANSYRNELIEQLRLFMLDWQGCVDFQFNDYGLAIAKLAADRIASLRGPSSEWISVKERLPNNHQHCLIWIDGGSLPCIGTLNRRHAHTLGSELIYYFALANGAGDRMLEEVTHWQPLPTPPATKDEA